MALCEVVTGSPARGALRLLAALPLRRWEPLVRPHPSTVRRDL